MWKFSKGWFNRFKRRYKISFRRPTNTAQNSQMIKKKQLESFTMGFTKLNNPVKTWTGRWRTDLSQLPFAFNQGSTYEITNSTSVWVSGGSSGLYKCQCTVQLTIFADGGCRVKPLFIFWGKGLRIPLQESPVWQEGYCKFSIKCLVWWKYNATVANKQLEYCGIPNLKHWIIYHVQQTFLDLVVNMEIHINPHLCPSKRKLTLQVKIYNWNNWPKR